MSSAAKAKLLVFAVFFVGIVAGALVENVYETRWSADADAANEKRSRREVDQLYDFLDLTPEQRQQWSKILADSKPEFDALWVEMRKQTEPTQAKVDALREKNRGKVRTFLTEEQKKKYNEYLEKQRQRRLSRPRPN